ncbi:MAG: lipocalin, partial [Gemmobacter sp.]
MPRLIPLLAALVAACAPAAPPPAAFRDPGGPIWSAAALDPARLAGAWRQVADFAAPGAPPCPGGTITFAPGGDSVSGMICTGGAARQVGGAVWLVAPGRLAVAGEAAPWWVLWLDADARTAVIGTPGGSFGL